MSQFSEDHFPTTLQRRVSVQNNYLPVFCGCIVSSAVQAAAFRLPGIDYDPVMLTVAYPARGTEPA